MQMVSPWWSKCMLSFRHLHHAKHTNNNTNLPLVVKTSADERPLYKQNRLRELLNGLHLMNQQEPSTYAFLLQGSLNNRALQDGKLVHAHIIQTGFNPDIFLDTKLVIMYAKCTRLLDACKVFDKMSERNVVSWTAMISGYANCGLGKEALMFFHQMQEEGIRPNQFTFASALSACASFVSLRHGKVVHEGVIRNGFQSDVVVGGALVDMYVKCGRIEDARKVFDNMAERDVVVWNSMIAGYGKNGCVDESLELFQKMPQRNVVSWTALVAGFVQNGYFHESLEFYEQMQLIGTVPDSGSFASVLPACAHLAALEHGKKVHKDIIKNGFQSDVVVGSALVDMYGKCGSIEDARNVFDGISKQNVYSWTVMIMGYAMNGHGMEALKVFEQMQQSGIIPDHVTFLGVLSACCHAGLVHEGHRYFECMTWDYQIKPSEQHYCCMVDLLGRAGCLDEAQDLINKMPIKPDVAVWESLLGACRVHGNIELGEQVAERLINLNSENASHYVLLSNIYAASGRWDDIEKIRKIMKERSIKKMPGCSWIEGNGKVHSFLVGEA